MHTTFSILFFNFSILLSDFGASVYRPLVGLYTQPSVCVAVRSVNARKSDEGRDREKEGKHRNANGHTQTQTRRRSSMPLYTHTHRRTHTLSLYFISRMKVLSGSI